MRRSLPTLPEAALILNSVRSRPARRPPPAAGRATAAAVKALEARFGPGADTLQSRWPEIVGDAMARRCEPVRLIRSRRGAETTLELRVAGAYAALIQHQAEDLLARINLVLGGAPVHRLRIVQGPLKGAWARKQPQANPQAAARRRHGPLDAAKEAELSQVLDTVPEGPLKEALVRLGRGVLDRGI